NDAAVDRIHLHHLHVQLHPLPGDVRRVLDLHPRFNQLVDGNETLDLVAHIDNHTLVHQAYYHRLLLQSNRVRLADAEPRILLRLLEAEADAFVLRIDVEDDDIHRVALLHHLGRVLDALGPGHVGDVDQPVDARFDLDEGAEAREVAH